MSMILRVVGCSSGPWYGANKSSGLQRGNRPIMHDSEVLEAVHEAISESPFVGEGYIKIWVRMRRKGKIASRARVLRIMRENHLLSPYRQDKATIRKHQHNGSIIQDKPNQLLGTDGKKFYVEDVGWCWFFGVIDYFNSKLISWHTCKRGTRYEAMEPVRAAVKKRFGNLCLSHFL